MIRRRRPVQLGVGHRHQISTLASTSAIDTTRERLGRLLRFGESTSTFLPPLRRGLRLRRYSLDIGVELASDIQREMRPDRRRKEEHLDVRVPGTQSDRKFLRGFDYGRKRGSP